MLLIWQNHHTSEGRRLHNMHKTHQHLAILKTYFFLFCGSLTVFSYDSVNIVFAYRNKVFIIFTDFQSI